MFNRPGTKLMGWCIINFFINSIIAIVGGILLIKIGVDRDSTGLFILGLVIIILFPIEAYITILPLFCLAQLCAHVEDIRLIEKKRENPEYNEITDSKYGLFVSHYMVEERERIQKEVSGLKQKRIIEKHENKVQTSSEATNDNIQDSNSKMSKEQAYKKLKNKDSEKRQIAHSLYTCCVCGKNVDASMKYEIIYQGKKQGCCKNCIVTLQENKESFSILKKPE